MRISDWSSDVCSSDLPRRRRHGGHLVEQLDLHPLPADGADDRLAGGAADAAIEDAGAGVVVAGTRLARRGRAGVAGGRSGGSRARSEEHTSELQSLIRISYAVFFLKNKHSSLSCFFFFFFFFFFFLFL